MEKRKRFIHIMARSNKGALVQLTLSEETSDLRGLIYSALETLASFSTNTESYSIEHIDSISHLHDMD